MKKIYIFSLILLLIDQIIKLFINKLLVKITLINNFLYLIKVNNYGVAFGMLSNFKWLIIFISIIILVLINLELKKEKLNMFNTLIYSFIIGGLLGNLIDRLFRGYVIDYISINLFNYDFPVFNFADILITIGFFLYVINILKKKGENEINSW